MGGGEECGEEDGLIGVRSAGEGVLALTVGCELYQSGSLRQAAVPHIPPFSCLSPTSVIWLPGFLLALVSRAGLF